MDKHQRIKILYSRMKDNSITDEECKEFFDLVEEEKSRQYLDSEIQNTWKAHYPEIESDEMVEQKKALKERLYNNPEPRATFDKSRFWKYGIAASITLLIALGIYLSDIFHSETRYSTGFAERQTIELPDGSIVELNANSSIVWSGDWEQKKVRKIHLTGEAFFEVVHLGQGRKFVVSTSDLDIEVLGTSFNVSKRSDVTDVFLSEGSVRLDLKGENQEEIKMSPGQRINYSRNENRIVEHKENNALTASWKNNIFYFNDKTVEEILWKVNQIYGVTFEFRDPSIKSLKLNFYVPYKDWDVAREAFELTMNLKMDKQENGKYLVSKK